MRVTVSLPAALVSAIHARAERTGRSRDQLFADAISEYLHRRSPRGTTQTIDRVIGPRPQRPDPFVRAAAYSVLSRIEW